MAAWRPLKRRDFVRKLRALGFDGPFSGTRHQFMISGQHRQTTPTNSEYSVPQLRPLIRQVGSILARAISLNEWRRRSEVKAECRGDNARLCFTRRTSRVSLNRRYADN